MQYSVEIKKDASPAQFADYISAPMYNQRRMDHYVIVADDSSFINMGVLASLCCWALGRAKIGCTFEIQGEMSRVRYLARMGLHGLLGLSEPSMNRNNEHAKFLPIRVVMDNADAVLDAVENVIAIVLAQCERGDKICSAFELALYVLIDIVRIHAESYVGGIVCAQTYPKKGTIQIGICDAGIGILGSLRRGKRYSDLQSDSDAIEKALLRGVTRDLDVGQGNGLAIATEIVKLNGGEMVIWSGKSSRRVPGHSPFPGTGFRNKFSGTGIFLTLRTDRVVDLSKTWIHGGDTGYLQKEAGRLSQAGRINVGKECVATIGRPEARALRFKMLIALEDADHLVLDFSYVHTTVLSFLDELVGRLAEHLGEAEFHRRIRFEGMRDTHERMATTVIRQRLGLEETQSYLKFDDEEIPF